MLSLLINGHQLIGVVLMVVAGFVIGMLWYTVLFGKKWMQLVGMTEDMVTPEMKKNARKAYALNIIQSFVMAYILAVLLNNMFIYTTLHNTLLAAFLLWLGFVATTSSTEYIFNTNKKPWALYCINVGFQLVNILVGACIIFFFS